MSPASLPQPFTGINANKIWNWCFMVWGTRIQTDLLWIPAGLFYRRTFFSNIWAFLWTVGPFPTEDLKGTVMFSNYLMNQCGFKAACVKCCKTPFNPRLLLSTFSREHETEPFVSQFRWPWRFSPVIFVFLVVSRLQPCVKGKRQAAASNWGGGMVKKENRMSSLNKVVRSWNGAYSGSKNVT